jgi:hypothetical protein
MNWLHLRQTSSVRLLNTSDSGGPRLERVRVGASRGNLSQDLRRGRQSLVSGRGLDHCFLVLADDYGTVTTGHEGASESTKMSDYGGAGSGRGTTSRSPFCLQGTR